jgi:hypothetical protein
MRSHCSRRPSDSPAGRHGDDPVGHNAPGLALGLGQLYGEGGGERCPVAGTAAHARPMVAKLGQASSGAIGRNPMAVPRTDVATRDVPVMPAHAVHDARREAQMPGTALDTGPVTTGRSTHGSGA